MTVMMMTMMQWLLLLKLQLLLQSKSTQMLLVSPSVVVAETVADVAETVAGERVN